MEGREGKGKNSRKNEGGVAQDKFEQQLTTDGATKRLRKVWSVDGCVSSCWYYVVFMPVCMCGGAEASERISFHASKNSVEIFCFKN